MTVGAIYAGASLGLREREVVQLTAAAVHSGGFLREENAPAGDAHLRALADFTRAIITRRGAVSDFEYSTFLAHGYGPRQALDIILGVSLATLCNFAATLAQTEAQRELQPFLPA